MARKSGYRGALEFNVRELLVQVLLFVGLLVFLAIPLLIVMLNGAGGMDLDTYKVIPDGTEVAQLLPARDTMATDQFEGYAAATYDAGDAGTATMSAQQFESPEAAVKWWSGIGSGTAKEGPGMHLRRWSDADKPFLAWVNDRYGFMMTATNDAALNRLIHWSDWIDAADEAGYHTGPRPASAKLLEDYPWVFVLVIDVLIVLFMWAIFAIFPMLATKRPARGTDAIAREELRGRILGLNGADSPFVLEDLGNYHLRGRWRFDDAGMVGKFAAEGFRELYQIDLYLKPSGTALALESRGSVNWDVNAVPPEASYSWAGFRGIVLYEYKAEKEWAFDPQSLRFKQALDFKFNADDFKGPIVQVVVQSGWTWRPIMFRPLTWRP